MSKVFKVDAHNANIQYLVDSAVTSKVRRGVKYSFSPRKSVQRWSNFSDGTGDLWVTDNILSEEVRKVIEEVATITDSPYKKSEKLVILKDDTNANRIKLFDKIIELCGGKL